MKKFHIRIWLTDGPKEQEMVQHDGLTFDAICDIENHIEDIKHGIHKVETQREKLIKLKKKFESSCRIPKECATSRNRVARMPLTKYEGDDK